MSTKRAAQPRVARTHLSILAAATDMFLKQGFVATNMDAIAASANVSKQTVYAHFESKEALFLHVVDSLTGQAADKHQEQVADPQDDCAIEDFLLGFALQQLVIVMTPQLMQLRRLVIGEAERFPGLGKALHSQGPRRAIGRLASAFTHYYKMGRIEVVDVTTAASFFNWLVMGGPTNDAMLLGDDAIPDADALRKHARESVRIFLAAYATKQVSKETDRLKPADPSH